MFKEQEATKFIELLYQILTDFQIFFMLEGEYSGKTRAVFAIIKVISAIVDFLKLVL